MRSGRGDRASIPYWVRLLLVVTVLGGVVSAVLNATTRNWPLAATSLTTAVILSLLLAVDFREQRARSRKGESGQVREP